MFSLQSCRNGENKMIITIEKQVLEINQDKASKVEDAVFKAISKNSRILSNQDHELFWQTLNMVINDQVNPHIHKLWGLCFEPNTGPNKGNTPMIVITDNSVMYNNLIQFSVI